MAEIQEWFDEGYLEDDVCKRLKRCVSPEALESVVNIQLEVVDQKTPKPEYADNKQPELKAARKDKQQIGTALATENSTGMEIIQPLQCKVKFPISNHC